MGRNGVTQSMYEKMFKVTDGTNRRRGRPAGVGPARFVFVFSGKDRDIARKAKQRATAIVFEENRERLKDLFEEEYKVLARRSGVSG